MFTKSTRLLPAASAHAGSDSCEITYGDKEMIRYLQRFIGYTLTGVIEEHAFAFLFGPGGNGKSVLLGTIAAALGDYATTAMGDVFTVRQRQ